MEAGWRPGSLIVIDEIWQLWPAGTNARNVRDQYKSFLAEHRHLVGENGLATEIVFVTQDLSQIANFTRSPIETTFRVTKLTNLGLKNHYRVDVYYGAATGASPPISKRASEIQGKFKKEIYALYKSHNFLVQLHRFHCFVLVAGFIDVQTISQIARLALYC